MSEVKIVQPTRFEDHRGFFAELYNRRRYVELGIDVEFVQDNHSLSREAGTLRGLHFQAPPHAQAKLVRCARGSIYDVALDIRQGSANYGKWIGRKLTSENGLQLFIPIGYAHGFVTLEPNTEIAYKCSQLYSPESEGSVLWDDPDLRINWPINRIPKISAKDAAASTWKDFKSPFFFGINS